MTAQNELNRLSHSAIVELFQLDLNPIGINRILYFCNDIRADGASVVYQGITYIPLPIKASGFEYTGKGSLPRPNLTVSNVGSLITAIIASYGDIVGSKFTRRRTLAKYLDNEPTADPNATFPDDIYFVDRKVTENKLVITFELCSSLDLEGVKIPNRVLISNSCPWVYRSSDCGYTGGAVATDKDLPTSDPAKDVCSKSLKACKMRFGEHSPLQYGGAPAVDNVRYGGG